MTEQEQIKAMTEKMKRCFEKNGLLNFKWFAEALVQAGYGRISEYIAEIERLEAEFKQLQTNAEILARGVRDLNHENYELTKKVKQAKIDVLNKAKERLDSAPNGWAYTTYIDELIEDVQNGK